MIAIFMDGTRDKPHKNPRRNSHVKRTHDLVSDQIKSLYIEGVGAGNRVKDGMQAITTKERVMRAYRFLAENYRNGDSISLFGFSRGANQCRILASFIYTIGVIDLKQIKEEAAKQKLLMNLYDLYISSGEFVKKNNLASFINNWEISNPGHEVAYDTSGITMIEVMGLWDTVEALILDDELEITTPIPQHLNQIFNVKKIFHAVSLDDNRAFNYTPILATQKDVKMHPHQNINEIVDEVWFNGSHKDVGGGVKSKKRDQLSGISLKWMLSNLSTYHIFKHYEFEPEKFGLANDMRRRWYLRKTSPGDTLRGIDKYSNMMNPNWNNQRIKVHKSVIDRLDSGIVQCFKLVNKDGTKRADWYDWEPFKHCFIKDTINGIEKIKFKIDKVCPCIEIVTDSTESNKIVKGEIINTRLILMQTKNQNNIVREIESQLSVADKMEERITQSLQQAEALRQSILKRAFEGRLV